MAGGLLLDTNVLILLVAGRTDRSIITKHKKLSAFSIADFDTLSRTIRPYDSLVTTPHVLAEASNLLAQHADPEKSRLLETLRDMIKNDTSEDQVLSASAADRPEFTRLGLTDCGLIEAAAPGTTVLTADLALVTAQPPVKSSAAWACL